MSRILWQGIAATELRSADGASAVVAEHGAHLLSWIPAGGTEMLFVSDRTSYSPGCAIRGGVPVIFPQFSHLGPFNRHGFARNVPWRLLSSELVDGCAIVRHGLSNDDVGAQQWPHRFALEMEVRLAADHLAMALTVRNPSDREWEFTAALHTYLRVNPLSVTRVDGLQGVHFIDQTQGGQKGVQTTASLAIENELDRIYLDPPASLKIDDGERRLVIRQTGFRDTVIWNPGAAKGDALADLETGDYRAFVCAEAAAVAHPIVLAAGAQWHGTQSLDILSGAG